MLQWQKDNTGRTLRPTFTGLLFAFLRRGKAMGMICPCAAFLMIRILRSHVGQTRTAAGIFIEMKRHD